MYQVSPNDFLIIHLVVHDKLDSKNMSRGKYPVTRQNSSGQNGSGQNGSGQNGTNKMVRTKW